MVKPIVLPYNYDALEPVLDTRTVALHYNNHYMGYVNRLNDLISKNPSLNEQPLSNLAQHLDLVIMTIRNQFAYNLGGVLNHELYFLNIGPIKTEPKGRLREAIERDFGSVSNFQNQFIEEANKLVGSGYTFLAVDRDKKLKIINLSNQDTPYFYDMIPIMTIDLWEHAYYLTYQSNRAEYIRNFFQIINYDEVEKNYEKIT